MKGLVFRRTLSTALVITSALSCAAHKRPKTSHEPKVSYPAVLKGRWSEGTCSFNVKTNKLTYSAEDQTVTITLDEDASEVNNLSCSDRFSALSSSTDIVIAVGGEKVLEGVRLIGYLSGRFVVHNSYGLKIPEEANDEKISGMYLFGDHLELTTRAGRSWVISLSDPVEGWTFFDTHSRLLPKNLFINFSSYSD